MESSTSSTIAEIGFEMYQKIIDEAIRELKRNEFRELYKEEISKQDDYVSDCSIDTDLEILIPDSYVESITERLSLYSRLDKCETETDLLAFHTEMTDRFGQVPEQVEDLFTTVRCRRLAVDLGFEKMLLKNEMLRCFFVGNPDSPYFQSSTFNGILQFLQTGTNKGKLKQVGKNGIPAQKANPCPTDNLSDYPGAWKPFSGYSAVAQFKAKPGSYNKSAAAANLDKLLALAKQAYPQPLGGNANFTKYLDFSSAYSFMPIGYHLHIGHPGFVGGARNNIDLSYETGVSLKFSINNPEIFASHITPYKVNGTDHYIGAMKNAESAYGINGQSVFLIHENFVSTNGWLDHYTEKIYRNEEPTQQWYIIPRENEPLFRYVTRKEYLTQFREEIKEYRDVYTRHIENQYKKYPESFKQTYEGLDDYRRRA